MTELKDGIFTPKTLEELKNKIDFSKKNDRENWSCDLNELNINEIKSEMFFNCKGLSKVMIPMGVTKIGKRAFQGCIGLTSIEIPESVTEISSGAFIGCNGLKSIKVADGNKKYDSRDNCNAIIETAVNILVCGCKTTVIPKSINRIGPWAFCGCTSLTSIVIPESVTCIGGWAFYNCKNLKAIDILGSTISIGISAIRRCIRLKSIVFPSRVTGILKGLLIECDELETIYVPANTVDYYIQRLSEKLHDKIKELNSVNKV